MPVHRGFGPSIEEIAGVPASSTAATPENPTSSVLLEERLMQTIESYDSNAESYTNRFRDVDLDGHRHRFSQQLPDMTAVVLDAGCGPGRDLGRLALDGFRAIGIDRSAGLLRLARNAGHDVVEGDFREMPFESGSFAGIWACASLLHLPIAELPAALNEFGRVLQTDGRLFLSVRHGCGIEKRLDPTGHTRWFYLYSGPQIERVLLESGFVDIELKVEPGAAHGTWVNVHARSGRVRNSH
jgi:SAM-dependent methyltransferase